MNFLSQLATVRGHTIWTGALGSETVVVDAGAHRGEFSRQLLSKYDCRCYLVEANPELASGLRSLSGITQTLPVALAASNGRLRFTIRENLESGSLYDRPGETGVSVIEVEAISLPSLMERARLSRIDLLKLDIEGAEFELIAQTPDLILSSIDQITVEFHDFLPSLRGRRLFQSARDRLHDLGFICCCMSFRTHGDVLFLNRKKLAIGRASALALSTAARWIRRVKAA